MMNDEGGVWGFDDLWEKRREGGTRTSRMKVEGIGTMRGWGHRLVLRVNAMRELRISVVMTRLSYYFRLRFQLRRDESPRLNLGTRHLEKMKIAACDEHEHFYDSSVMTTKLSALSRQLSFQDLFKRRE